MGSEWAGRPSEEVPSSDGTELECWELLWVGRMSGSGLRAWPLCSGLVVPTVSRPDEQGQSKVTCLYTCEVNSDLLLWGTSCVAGKSCVR